MTTVLVCGGRYYGVTKGSMGDEVLARRQRVHFALHMDELHLKFGPFTHVIHGDASGADSLAKRWALRKGIKQTPYPAAWTVDGQLDRSAGPRRNQQMLTEGKPQLVVAFPGNSGTADMTERARMAGVKVVEVV